MLDSTDVRAGNWVLKITGTDANTQAYFQYKAIAPDEYYHTFAKACFPIKITPSILGECGFMHEFGDWYRNIAAEGIEDGLPFLRYKHADKLWYLQDIKLWAQPLYVHQLQNLFYALTGEELPVNLQHYKNLEIVGPINFFVKPLAKTTLLENLL